MRLIWYTFLLSFIIGTCRCHDNRNTNDDSYSNESTYANEEIDNSMVAEFHTNRLRSVVIPIDVNIIMIGFESKDMSSNEELELLLPKYRSHGVQRFLQREGSKLKGTMSSNVQYQFRFVHFLLSSLVQKYFDELITSHTRVSSLGQQNLLVMNPYELKSELESLFSCIDKHENEHKEEVEGDNPKQSSSSSSFNLNSVCSIVMMNSRPLLNRRFGYSTEFSTQELNNMVIEILLNENSTYSIPEFVIPLTEPILNQYSSSSASSTTTTTTTSTVPPSPVPPVGSAEQDSRSSIQSPNTPSALPDDSSSFLYYSKLQNPYMSPSYNISHLPLELQQRAKFLQSNNASDHSVTVDYRSLSFKWAQKRLNSLIEERMNLASLSSSSAAAASSSSSSPEGDSSAANRKSDPSVLAQLSLIKNAYGAGDRKRILKQMRVLLSNNKELTEELMNSIENSSVVSDYFILDRFLFMDMGAGPFEWGHIDSNTNARLACDNPSHAPPLDGSTHHEGNLSFESFMSRYMMNVTSSVKQMIEMVCEYPNIVSVDGDGVLSCEDDLKVVSKHLDELLLDGGLNSSKCSRDANGVSGVSGDSGDGGSSMKEDISIDCAHPSSEQLFETYETIITQLLSIEQKYVHYARLIQLESSRMSTTVVQDFGEKRTEEKVTRLSKERLHHTEPATAALINNFVYHFYTPPLTVPSVYLRGTESMKVMLERVSGHLVMDQRCKLLKERIPTDSMFAFDKRGISSTVLEPHSASSHSLLFSPSAAFSSSSSAASAASSTSSLSSPPLPSLSSPSTTSTASTTSATSGGSSPDSPSSSPRLSDYISSFFSSKSSPPTSPSSPSTSPSTSPSQSSSPSSSSSSSATPQSPHSHHSSPWDHLTDYWMPHSHSPSHHPSISLLHSIGLYAASPHPTVEILRVANERKAVFQKLSNPDPHIQIQLKLVESHDYVSSSSSSSSSSEGSVSGGDASQFDIQSFQQQILRLKLPKEQFTFTTQVLRLDTDPKLQSLLHDAMRDHEMPFLSSNGTITVKSQYYLNSTIVINHLMSSSSSASSVHRGTATTSSDDSHTSHDDDGSSASSSSSSSGSSGGGSSSGGGGSSGKGCDGSSSCKETYSRIIRIYIFFLPSMNGQSVLIDRSSQVVHSTNDMTGDSFILGVVNESFSTPSSYHANGQAIYYSLHDVLSPVLQCMFELLSYASPRVMFSGVGDFEGELAVESDIYRCIGCTDDLFSSSVAFSSFQQHLLQRSKHLLSIHLSIQAFNELMEEIESNQHEIPPDTKLAIMDIRYEMEAIISLLARESGESTRSSCAQTMVILIRKIHILLSNANTLILKECEESAHTIDWWNALFIAVVCSIVIMIIQISTKQFGFKEKLF